MLLAFRQNAFIGMSETLFVCPVTTTQPKRGSSGKWQKRGPASG
jgi:hypothetical protein